MAWLGGLFEHSPWVAEAAFPCRPFASIERLHATMMHCVRNVSDDRRFALLKGHPELAGKEAQARTMTVASTFEQGSAGLDRLSQTELRKLQQLNKAYSEKFGFPFIICVRRHSKDSIFGQFERRLSNDFKTECEAAMAEVGRITALRLDQRLISDGSLKLHGHLAVHIVDLARGLPAHGMAVDLYAIESSGIEYALRSNRADSSGIAIMLDNRPLPIGLYELRFHCREYFRIQQHLSFLDLVPVRFSVAEPEGDYHIPFRVTQSSYFTYRGR